MAHDLRLLLEAVAPERPSGLEPIIIFAERVAHQRQVETTALLSLPDWYISGLISYISRKWDVEIDDHVRDGIITKKYFKIFISRYAMVWAFCHNIAMSTREKR